ncbi:MAG: hypothetical protein QXR30_01985 [Candidatus Woesearchaeota archaeon]
MKYCLIRLNNVVVFENGKISVAKDIPSDAKILNSLDYYDLTNDELEILRKMLKFQVSQKEVLNCTSKKISESYDDEDVVKEYIKMYDDIAKIKNIFAKRIRDFIEIYYPEIYEKSNDAIVNILKSNFSNEKSELGGKFNEKQLKGFKMMIDSYLRIDEFENNLKNEIERTMQEIAPNFSYLARPLIAARMLNSVGSLKELALLPASTIQTLGAEKAMFRFLKTKTKPPKYGYLFAHPLIAKAKDKGKIARKLANKLSIMIKKDVFGDKQFIADKILEELEKEL